MKNRETNAERIKDPSAFTECIPGLVSPSKLCVVCMQMIFDIGWLRLDSVA